ncbi:hypothetical protein [Kallotenue papyrolyticum]|uniref:hypothetical protein n=1 Tax=Kallotenue papyrolyticum TaxID=1325125 RepID=UPI0004785B59|nr:hypothetical protein [Kallotenue papyrolyticum]
MFTLRGNALTVQSSRHDWLHYDCTLETCECVAFERGLQCWHRALLVLLLAYETLHAADMAVVAYPKPKRAPRYRTARARVTEEQLAAYRATQPKRSWDEVQKLADELYA